MEFRLPGWITRIHQQIEDTSGDNLQNRRIAVKKTCQNWRMFDVQIRMFTDSGLWNVFLLDSDAGLNKGDPINGQRKKVRSCTHQLQVRLDSGNGQMNQTDDVQNQRSGPESTGKTRNPMIENWSFRARQDRRPYSCLMGVSVNCIISLCMCKYMYI